MFPEMNIFYTMRKMLQVPNPRDIDVFFCEKMIPDTLEKCLLHYNPKEIMDEFEKYFRAMNLKTHLVHKGEVYYRGRIGNLNVPGAIDDCDTFFTMPYYDKSIVAAPPLLTKGGRFNRAGTSHLYLASDIETCLAEVHLQVGQNCSVGRFVCKEDMELINLSDYANSTELKIWYDILTQPIQEEKSSRYLITQFLADVLQQINPEGLFFKSVQSVGYNVVCFAPAKFKLVPFSERIYRANAIRYTYSMVQDTIQRYKNRNDEYQISSYNSKLDEENEELINYMLSWIEHEQQQCQL